MERDAVVRDAKEALATVVQQRDVKENELQGLRAELKVSRQTEIDVARRTKAQCEESSSARDTETQERYEKQMQNVTREASEKIARLEATAVKRY